MKNLKTKIALMFGIACVATLLFALPALACGNDYDYSKHGGFIHATKTKSWFGVHAEAWQEKYVEPTPAVEESIAQPVQEEQVQKNQDIKTPVQEQPVIEEPTFEEPGVETPVEEERTGFIDDKEEELYADKVEEKHEKIEGQNKYKPWLKSRASITKDNTAKHHICPTIEQDLYKSSNWKTKLTTQSESGSWGIKPTHIVIKNITPPVEANSPHSILLMIAKVKIEKDNQQNIDEYSPQKARLRYYIKGYWHLTNKSVKKGEEKVIYVPWYQTDETIQTIHTIARKLVYAPWENNFSQDFVHGVIRSAPAIKENISKPQFKEWHGFIGANGITRPAQTTIIYKTHNSNTDMRTIYIRGLETFGPYAVNNNRKFSDEYGKLVPRQIQHIEPHRIVEDNIYKKDSTQPQKWIINELGTPEVRKMGPWSFDWVQRGPKQIYIKPNGFANESTRKDIGFILLRHGVPVIYNNENIYHLEPSRIRHIYPTNVFENTLSKGKDTPFITKHFVPVFDSANIKELEKTGIVKVRLYRPFTTSIFSSNTEVYLRPLRVILGAHLIPEEERLEIATQLGGGQHQRVALARLLFPKFA